MTVQQEIEDLRMESDHALPSGRPAHVTFVCTCIFLATGLALLLFAFAGSIILASELGVFGKSPLGRAPGVLASFSAVGIAIFLNLWGAVSLFRLRKSAAYILPAAFVFLAVDPLVQVLAIGPAGYGNGFVGLFINPILALGVLGGICIYAWALLARGTLQ